MKNLKIFPKILLFFLVLSGALWIGSYFVRMVESYQIFEGTEFSLRPYINDQNIGGILRSFEPSIISTLVLYIIFIVTFVLFIITSKISLKNNGWLFIITIIILLTLPFEIYLLTIDFKIIGLINSANFNSGEVLNLIIERFKIFGSFPVIELCCYGAIVYFFLFQPLKKNQEINNNENKRERI
jgi:hypothetical protein